MSIKRVLSQCKLLLTTVCWVVLGFAPLDAEAQKFNLQERVATRLNRAPAASVTAPLAATPNSASAQYQFLTFSVPGALQTGAIGINDVGVVVVDWQDSASNFHGALWHEQMLQQLDDPGFAATELLGLNDAGVVAASVGPSTSVQSAVLYDPRRGGWIMLPDFQGSPLNSAEGINNAGIVVGGGCPSLIVGCVGWTWNGHLYSPFTVPGSDPAFGGTNPFSINDKDQIVGVYYDSSAIGHAFLKDGDRYTSFDVPGGTDTSPFGINDRGDIVGIYFDAAFALHGFVLRNGQFATIDCPGAIETLVYSINNRGDIAGQCAGATGVPQAFIGYRQQDD